MPASDMTFKGLCAAHGLLVGLLMSALRIGAWPVAWIVAKITDGKVLWRADLVQLALLALPLGLLWRCPPDSFLYVLWPSLRLFDLEWVYMRSFVYNKAPASKPRAVVFLFLHYTEVIVLFALLYLFMQSHAPIGADAAHSQGLFVKSSDGGHALTAPQAVFFSFITGATIGYGDIAPNHAADRAWVIGVYLLTWLKTLMILSFTLVELARVIGFAGDERKPTS